MYDEFIRNRINELRIKNNISEYQLSLVLVHCQGYIQSKTFGRNMPSMNRFWKSALILILHQQNYLILIFIMLI